MRDGFLATKQLQSLDSFRGLFVIKSKKKQVTTKNHNFTIKINSYNKIVQKISKNAIFKKKMVERSSDEPSNYPRCLL